MVSSKLRSFFVSLYFFLTCSPVLFVMIIIYIYIYNKRQIINFEYVGLAAATKFQ